jgi:hypothetical protein
MGGYAKIDKNKIQPSPALAALTGLLGGLNAHKKEMQAREDAQNKANMELGKWMREFGLKERETQVKEQAQTTNEQTLQMNIEDKLAALKMAREDLDLRHEDMNIKTNEYLDKVQQRTDDADINSLVNQTKIKMNEITENLKSINRMGEMLAEAKIKFGDPSKWEGVGTEQIGTDIKFTNDLALEDVRQQGMNTRNNADNARMASEGEKDRANRITVKGMDTGTESNDPKIKNFLSIQKANQSFFGTVLTSPNKIIDDMTAKYMGDRSQAEVDAWNELTLGQRKGLTEPVPVGLSKRAKGGWNILGWQTKIKAKPTEMLTGSDLINFRNATTQAMRNSLLSEHPDKKEALQYLIDKGASEVAAQAIIDEVYKKK